MSLGSFIRKQFIDVLQWTEDTDGVLAWRYPMEDQEIQYGGQLTVRETQVAIFVNEGKVADVFQPGLYKLETRTLPVLTYLKNWDKLFQSPFKSDVYFFSTRLQLGRRWGTAQPVTIRDREFGFVQLRAFGIYSYRIVDAAAFHREVSGTRAQYTVDDLEQQLRNLVVTAMSTTFGSADVPFVDMAANQTLLSQRVAEALVPVFTRYGLALDAFAVESVSLPAELQKALDLRIGAGMAGDLARATQYQTAQAIPLAAQNPGGIAGVGAGLAAGAVIGQAMAGQIAGAAQPAPAAPPAPVAAPVAAAQPAAAAEGTDYVQRLEQLKALLDKGLVTEEDYARAKADILAKLTR
ncbi:SPFH domain-containing protein [Burkholderia sp. BCC1993]|uniref:SPFH domain-containing protein n=1 Tax=Burkholderia sp. BCC1993 TaxID=2817444 RepID=UPI002AB28032|nr:SPFH domain-containing protein [Burkholderia sp. BCC1993]